MRRQECEIREWNEIVAAMERCDVCRIGFSDEQEPYIVPMNFGMKREGEALTLYFHCAREGRKLDLFRRYPRVCFEMDCDHALASAEDAHDCTMHYVCVMGTGTLRETEGEEKLEGLRLLMSRHGHPQNDFSESAVQVTTVLALTIEHISGKRH